VLFWRGRLSVSSKQGDVTLYLPAFRAWGDCRKRLVALQGLGAHRGQ
jgi:hypothetical protein